jgi:hypothetical protein
MPLAPRRNVCSGQSRRNSCSCSYSPPRLQPAEVRLQVFVAAQFPAATPASAAQLLAAGPDCQQLPPLKAAAAHLIVLHVPLSLPAALGAQPSLPAMALTAPYVQQAA